MAEAKKCTWTDKDGEVHECEHEATHDNGTHCIFHAKEKDADEFKAALKALVQEWIDKKVDKWDFSGFVFPDDIEAADITPELDENDQPRFPVKVNFNHATFSGVAYFSSATFSGEAYFISATFSEDAYFKRATFSGSADFDSATFSGDAYFDSATFSGSADFLIATFSGDAYFWRATFSGDAYFGSATFSGDAYFGSATFSGNAHFWSATFSGDASFSSVRFYRGADFRETSFLGQSLFRKSTIRRTARKNRERYGGFDVNMTNCSFARLGNFTECTIIGHVKWAWPGEGDKWAKPHAARLKPQASLEFSRASTQQTTEYPKGSLTFDEIKLDQTAGQIPRGTLLFKSLGGKDYLHLNEHPVRREKPILDLRKNELEDDVKLKIEDCRMEHILLEGTDCTQIKFYNNKWPRIKDRIASLLGLKVGRDAVGDECYALTGAEDKSDWQLIRRTYQELARRFREDLDHPRANEFDRGSFEMRRREALKEIFGKKEERHILRGLSTYIGMLFYKNVSHYSGSLAMPLLWILVLILGCSFFYAKLEYTLDWTQIDYGFMWERIMESLRAAFSLANDTTTSEGVRTLKVMERVFSLIFLTLFVFTIRRRFKH